MALRRRTTQVDSYGFERGILKLNTYLPRGNMTLSRAQGGLMHDAMCQLNRNTSSSKGRQTNDHISGLV